MKTPLKRNRTAGLLLALLICGPTALLARKFYVDDPLVRMPPPRNVAEVASQNVGVMQDFFSNTFSTVGERDKDGRPLPAQGINTLGEVPDSEWYSNRHYAHRMNPAELAKGPGNNEPPSQKGPWTIVSAKNEGITPGFTIEDAEKRKYILKFDPMSNPEMASAADVIASKFFYALGYNVPENYVVYFHREQLQIGGDSEGRPLLTNHDLDVMLHLVPRDPKRGYRALASRFVEGKVVGPFRYVGTRQDDPNDIFPHENRRDLRGLYVFAAWLGHHDTKAGNSLDSVIEQDGRRFVRHYLIDFGATLGSASFAAKSARAGNEYLFEWTPAAVQMATLGLHVPRWARADYGNYPSIGRFESEIFDPDDWKSNYPNPAFQNRLPDDTFWATKQVMGFTDEEIRAIVHTGELSDQAAEAYLVQCLIERRDKIGKTFFSKVLPLDHFTVTDGRLTFDDLAVKYDFVPSRNYEIRWSSFNNETEKKIPLAGGNSFSLPRQFVEGTGEAYVVAEIQADNPKQTVTVYLRKRASDIEVIGIERGWA